MPDLEDGKTEQALTELEKLTKEIPKFVEAHVSPAMAYDRLKRKDDSDRQPTGAKR
jgi:hypothetical protein